MTFQSTHGLNPDGVVGNDTREALNISPEQRVMQIQVNMARWAKLSKELGDHYIIVNIPAFTMNLVENGNSVLNMKAIVGKPERPTPEIESTVTRIVLNPYWNVPKLIAQKDIIPKIINDPGYLDEMNIKILNREDDSDSYEIDPGEIDWQAVEAEGFQYHFRQDPGENNALGLVKFEFENSHDVYMHDTPAKELFDAEKRDFSSGCIRLEKPFELVTYLMAQNENWSEERMQSILDAGKTSYIKIARPMPVIIAYLTAFVDDSGQLQFRNDIYGWDQPDPPADPQ
jgi:murein L,D-transpeptidase YcbB/YkuD